MKQSESGWKTKDAKHGVQLQKVNKETLLNQNLFGLPAAHVHMLRKKSDKLSERWGVWMIT